MNTFTTTFVRRVKPRSKMYEMTCDTLSGFILRVLPSGKKVFLVRYRVNGKDRRERIGRWGPTLTVDVARRRAAIMLRDASALDSLADEIEQRETIQPARAAPPRPKRTVRELVKRYIEEYVDVYLKPRTADNYRSLLAKIIVPKFGKLDYQSITRGDVMALHASLARTPGKANTVACVIGSLYIRIIDDWELSDMRNPATRIRRFRHKKHERFLKPEERRAVHEVMLNGVRTPCGRKGHLDPSSVWAITLLCLTGLRRDEIRDLKWGDVDWQHASFLLRDTKTGPRNVPVAGQVMDLLRMIHDHWGNPQDGYVVTSRTGKRLSSINRTWDQIRQAAGIPDVRLHDLRHSFASDALMSGVPLAIVGEMLGHRQASSTQRYAHIANEAVRQGLETTTARIAGTVSMMPELEIPQRPRRTKNIADSDSSGQ